ncbi:MAG TPA: glycine reductase [Dehalococcoidia bacterium]|nr:glycine reductase [Dehalococcoidia bacterium]
MDRLIKLPVIQGVRYQLGHAPGLVRHGSKPSREIEKDPALLQNITAHLRPYSEAVAYAPNRAFLGGLYPDDLADMERPWFPGNGETQRWLPHGEIMPEEELIGLLKISDAFELVWLEEGFTGRVRKMLVDHPLIQSNDLDALGNGRNLSDIEAEVAKGEGALPLCLRDGSLVGCVNRAHDEDASLTADVILENLACKATAAMALRTLLRDQGLDGSSIEYVLNTGEEAVGERYQRGGGNLAKAVAEMCGLENATGCDVKAFCCGPVHALVMAGALVSSGLYRQVAVVGGCSLAKLGMKFQGHLEHDQPILEDILASVAVLVGEDDGVSPVLRLDSVGRHTVGAGSSQQAIFEQLISLPLQNLGLGYRDVDKYATELHNPEVTEPSGSGNVPNLNYRLIGALAVRHNEIERAALAGFVETHGMPGFSPTQGHIASAVPFLGHAVERMQDGRMNRAMFLAKGSLFLGRMTQMSDGMSFVLEANPSK